MRKSSESALLFQFNEDRQSIIRETIDRVTRGAIQRAWESEKDGLEYLLNEAAFLEMSRIDSGEGSSTGLDYAFWKDVARGVGRASEEENAESLRKIVTRYATDIAGNFRPGVYRLATSILPRGISMLFSRQSGSTLFNIADTMRPLQERIELEGELDTIRALAERGTLVFVPTHSSHMDSLLMGWALHACGLPPVTYGAGKNLFTNPMTSFFMDNLGAYKVDRRLRHTIYKRVLKSYSQVLLERGYHSLFFPGGGRSRSNQIEQHLKLGLMGTSLDAFTCNVVEKRAKPGVFIVPVTINYTLVLEAETLVEDHLRTDGGGRYIIDNDEFSDIRKVAHFLKSILEMDASVLLRFCAPLDVFGNEVDPEGRSIDRRGRHIERRDYLLRDGVPQPNRTRDHAYTRELGERVASAFRRNNVIFPLHIVSLALFEYLRRQRADGDLYRTIRFGRGEIIALNILEGETERLIRIVRRAEERGELRLSRPALTLDSASMVTEAIRYFGTFHQTPVGEIDNERFRLLNPDLLYFYAGRLRGYDFERQLEPNAGPTA